MPINQVEQRQLRHVWVDTVANAKALDLRTGEYVFVNELQKGFLCQSSASNAPYRDLINEPQPHVGPRDENMVIPLNNGLFLNAISRVFWDTRPSLNNNLDTQGYLIYAQTGINNADGAVTASGMTFFDAGDAVGYLYVINNTGIKMIDLAGNGMEVQSVNGTIFIGQDGGEAPDLIQIGTTSSSGSGIDLRMQGVHWLKNYGSASTGDILTFSVDGGPNSEPQILLTSGNNLSILHKYMKWQNVWSAGTYQQFDVVFDEGWAMVANKTTTDRAAPQLVGSPTYLAPDVPTWVEGSNVGGVISGHQITFNVPAEVTRIRVWVPELTSDTNYRFYIADVTDPDNPKFVEFNDPLLAEDQWINITATEQLVLSGTVWLTYIDAYTGGTNTVTGGWTYEGTSNGNPPTQGWNRRSNNSEIAIDKTDLDGIDRTTELLGLVAGSQLQFVKTSSPTNLITAEVTSVTDDGSAIRYGITNFSQTGTINTGDITTFTGDTNAPAVTKYVYQNGYWPAPNGAGLDVEGFLQFGGVPQVGDEQTLFGIDIRVQEYQASPDWDLLAFSGGASGGGGGGGGDGQTIYDQVLNAASDILGQNPTNFLGQVHWAFAEKEAYKAVTDNEGIDVWQPIALRYNPVNDTYELSETGDGQTQNVGQEIFFPVKEDNGGSVVIAATPPALYIINGDDGTFATAIPAAASDLDEGEIFGVATTPTDSDFLFKITTYGVIRDIDTSAWPVNSELYADTVAGELTNIKPATNIWAIGTVLVSDVNVGAIFVNTIGSNSIDQDVVPIGESRAYFTTNSVSLGGNPFYLLGAVSTSPSTGQAVSVPDNSLVWIGSAGAQTTVGVEGPFVIDSGVVTGKVEFEIAQAQANEKIYIRIHRINNANGNRLNVGIAQLESPLLNSPVSTIITADLTGTIASPISVLAGERLEYEIGVEKVGSAGPNKVFTIYQGDVRETWIQGETGIAASDVTYDNSGSTLSATDVQQALDELDATKATLPIPSDQVTYTNNSQANVEGALDDLYANKADSPIDADDVNYDNSTSGLTATDVQAAIDELNSNMVTLPIDATDVNYDDSNTQLGASDVQDAIEALNAKSSVGYGFRFKYKEYVNIGSDYTNLLEGEFSYNGVNDIGFNVKDANANYFKDYMERFAALTSNTSKIIAAKVIWNITANGANVAVESGYMTIDTEITNVGSAITFKGIEIQTDALTQDQEFQIDVHPMAYGQPPVLAWFDAYPPVTSFGGAYGFSVSRKLVSGNVFVVNLRRASDNTLKKFTVNELNDGTAQTWLGGTQGFVRSLYCQLTGYELNQITNGTQPTISNGSGIINKKDGLTYIKFDGTQWMNGTSLNGVTTLTQVQFLSVRVNDGLGVNNDHYLCSYGTSTGGELRLTTQQYRSGAGNGRLEANRLSTGVEMLYTNWGETNIANIEMRINNQDVTNTAFNGTNVLLPLPDNTFYLGTNVNNQGTGSDGNFDFWEWIVYEGPIEQRYDVENMQQNCVDNNPID